MSIFLTGTVYTISFNWQFQSADCKMFVFSDIVFTKLKSFFLILDSRL